MNIIVSIRFHKESKKKKHTVLSSSTLLRETTVEIGVKRPTKRCAKKEIKLSVDWLKCFCSPHLYAQRDARSLMAIHFAAILTGLETPPISH